MDDVNFQLSEEKPSETSYIFKFLGVSRVNFKVFSESESTLTRWPRWVIIQVKSNSFDSYTNTSFENRSNAI